MRKKNKGVVTPFGKMLRKIRVETDETQADMANGLNVSGSFLSAVETGDKNIPDNWVELISDKYNLSDEARESLSEAARLSVKELKISMSGLSDDDRRELLYMVDEFLEERVEG